MQYYYKVVFLLTHGLPLLFIWLLVYRIDLLSGCTIFKTPFLSHPSSLGYPLLLLILTASDMLSSCPLLFNPFSSLSSVSSSSPTTLCHNYLLYLYIVDPLLFPCYKLFLEESTQVRAWVKPVLLIIPKYVPILSIVCVSDFHSLFLLIFLFYVFLMFWYFGDWLSTKGLPFLGTEILTDSKAL